jgi:hypothetical protein
MILEAVTLQDLWIWFAFFRLPGSQNYINILEQSFMFSELHTQISQEHSPRFMKFIQRHVCIRDSQTHSQLQSDLIEHLL